MNAARTDFEHASHHAECLLLHCGERATGIQAKAMGRSGKTSASSSSNVIAYVARWVEVGRAACLRERILPDRFGTKSVVLARPMPRDATRSGEKTSLSVRDSAGRARDDQLDGCPVGDRRNGAPNGLAIYTMLCAFDAQWPEGMVRRHACQGRCEDHNRGDVRQTLLRDRVEGGSRSSATEPLSIVMIAGFQ